MGHDKQVITDHQRKGVYDTYFHRFAFGKPSLSLPRLILIGAQPGAGKTQVAEKARKELKALGAPVMADIDDIRPDYPDVEDIFEAAPFKMSSIINTECWGWTSQLLLDAKHAKNNIVYQATIRQASSIENLVKDFQKDGFAVDLYVVAVNAKQSVQGIFSRFERDIADRNAGKGVIPRWVPLSFHNQVYRVFPYNIDYLSENARLERVGVFSRDGRDLYFSEGQLIHRGVGDAIIKEQKRDWSQDERNVFCATWKKLAGQLNERPAGILKPKWYVRTAELYSTEAEYFAQAQALFSYPAPSGILVAHRTPYHHFVEDKNGLFVSYERMRGNKTASRPALITSVSPKPEPT